jgi:hypothetical protein
MLLDHTNRSRLGGGVILCTALLTYGQAAIAADVQSVAPLGEQLKQEYVDAFSPLGMIAVLIPIGQEPGDVLDRLGEEFVHRRDECFPNLRAHESPSSVPYVEIGASAALRFGLGLRGIGDAELSAFRDNLATLRFDSVTAQTVAQSELRQTVNRQTCPEIAQLVDRSPRPSKAEPC